MILTPELIEDVDKIINKGTWNNNQFPNKLFFGLIILPENESLSELEYKPELQLEELLELKGYTFKIISIILQQNGKINNNEKDKEYIYNLENSYGFYAWLGDIPIDASNKRKVYLNFDNYQERLKKCYVNPDNYNYGIK